MIAADLHTHSTSSDGEWSPERVVECAKREGLSAMALTDHDTSAGLAEAFRAGEAHGVEVIGGVEISSWQDGQDWHILGYGYDTEDVGLRELFDAALASRRRRGAAMVERLVELEMPITMDAVLAEAGDGAIGRPHVAKALVKAGHVGSIREAFDRWLGDGKPAYVEKARVTPAEAITALHRAGGVAVAAHPGCYGGIERLEPALEAGLDGVEVEHSLNDAPLKEALLDLARSRGLIKTGGSDFHFPGQLTVGSLGVPYEWVEELKDRIASRRAERS